ncbi:hypothetical protein [Pseudomonas sp. GL-R-19]|uniref:hypothetical protein n=1 Tax=Pseudomonas sp. GL-R-19 TaxID=2832391 RepID=UPI001CBCDED6|nr:hypothetical protein [Pseudomonas sp. GL-R-19]
MALALAGLLLQTRHEPSAPPSWKNLSKSGRLVLLLLLIISTAKIYKGYYDDELKTIAGSERASEMRQLQTSNASLLETNEHLIKVMSVASGYNALLSGVIYFEQPTNKTKITDSSVRHALENIFVKYAEVTIKASNKLGDYSGRVDFGYPPEVKRYLNLSLSGSDATLIKYREKTFDSPAVNAFYFEVRCPNLKILNREKIQYARFSSQEPLTVSVRKYEYWGDFERLYHVRGVYIDKLEIEELGPVRIAQDL